MLDPNTHLKPILTSKWLPYTVTLAASALIYTLLPTYTHLYPHHKVHKGLSYAHHSHSAEIGELQKKAKELYPEYFHGEGHYAHLPMGAVKYWILGPEKGTKVRIVLYACYIRIA